MRQVSTHSPTLVEELKWHIAECVERHWRIVDAEPLHTASGFDADIVGGANGSGVVVVLNSPILRELRIGLRLGCYRGDGSKDACEEIFQYLAVHIVQLLLFEIKSEYHHVACDFAYRLGEIFHCRVVLKVGAVLFENVAKSEAEFDFGAELKVGQIEVATEANSEHGIGGSELKLLAALFRHVEHTHNATHQIGTAVMVAQSGVFQVERHHHIGRLYILSARSSHGVVCVAESHNLVAKLHTRRQTQVEVAVETQVGENAHGESR